MSSYTLDYVDDALKVDTYASGSVSISQVELAQLILRNNWSDPVAKKFVGSILKESMRYDNIHLRGFIHPNLFIDEVRRSNVSPNAIVLDWDFGQHDTETTVDTLLSITQSSKIFVLTGNELESEVDRILTPKREPNLGRRLSVFSKTRKTEAAKNTQENLLEEILTDFQSYSTEIEYQGTTIKFYPSPILPKENLIWLLDSILSAEFVLQFLLGHDKTINNEIIEEMFDKSEEEFYINGANDRIFSRSGKEIAKYMKEELKPITPLYAVKYIDLIKLDEALEKGYADLPSQQ
jgi:hypothetical protein